MITSGLLLEELVVLAVHPRVPLVLLVPLIQLVQLVTLVLTKS